MEITVRSQTSCIADEQNGVALADAIQLEFENKKSTRRAQDLLETRAAFKASRVGESEPCNRYPPSLFNGNICYWSSESVFCLAICQTTNPYICTVYMIDKQRLHAFSNESYFHGFGIFQNGSRFKVKSL